MPSMKRSSDTQADKVRNRLLLSCLFAGASALAVYGAAFDSAFAQEPIKLGVLSSVTGPGAGIGAALTIGAEMAVADINKAGGLLGRPVVIVRGDTQSNPTTAASEVKRLVEREKIDLLIGPLVSQEIVPTVTVTTEAKIAQVTTAGTAALTPQVGPYHFSLNASSQTAAASIVDFVSKQMKGATVGILADDGGQAKTGVAALKQELQKAGITLAGEQEFRNRTEDMTPQILALKRANPGVVLVFFSFVEDGAKMLNTFRDVGWKPKIVGSTAVSIYAPAISRTVDANAFDNVYGLAYKAMTKCANEKGEKGPYATFIDRLKEFSPQSAGKVSVSLASEYYDGVRLMEAAVKALGKTNGADVARWIETEGSKIPLIHGSVSPSATSHFLFGPNELSAVESPNKIGDDGLMTRSGC